MFMCTVVFLLLLLLLLAVLSCCHAGSELTGSTSMLN
jgi:hypothetical protein